MLCVFISSVNLQIQITVVIFFSAQSSTSQQTQVVPFCIYFFCVTVYKLAKTGRPVLYLFFFCVMVHKSVNTGRAVLYFFCVTVYKPANTGRTVLYLFFSA